jgi:phage replication O-like protein O
VGEGHESNAEGREVIQPMKNPQLEDGFTRIANELFEAILGFGFSGTEYAVVFAIIRKTYGYGKKEDDMSASQIGEMIGKHRNHVTVAINELVSKSVLTKRQGSYGMILGVNKDYQNWGKKVAEDSTETVLDKDTASTKSVPLQLVRNPLRTSTESVQVGSTKSVHTKENLPKETTKRKRVSLGALNFADWIAKVKAENKKPIPEGHAVFEYAKTINLPEDFLRLCWLEFRNEHANREDKKQKDWPATFQVYVRKNYYRLWFKKDGEWQLTTAGVQLQDEMRGAI